VEIEWGETIVYTIPEIEPEIEHIEPENIPLDVLFEDDDIIAINKPPGLVVHPGVGQKSGTLVHALTYHFSQLSNVNGQLRPGIVHRLDQNTSGVILVAKNNQAHADLASQFEQRKIQRNILGLLGAIGQRQMASSMGLLKGNDLIQRRTR
jgi:23S rRNA pseudouridine1911/1915/1917 synthase